ncbi:MAG: energy transducer TonB [Bacteroidota bacterium]
MNAIKLFVTLGICLQMAYSQETQIAITHHDLVEVAGRYVSPEPLNLFMIADQINNDYARNEHGIEGSVRISILVDQEGNYVTSKFLGEYPPALTRSVMKYIHILTFTPARQHGLPVSDWVTIKFNFSLEG